MRPRWVYPLLILFVVFFILSNPESAGPQARTFFGWIGDQASAAGTFLDGLFDDDDEPSVGGGSGNSGSNDGDPSTNNGSSSNSQDSFSTLGPIVVRSPDTL